MIIWVTGLSGSGKTTIAKSLSKKLQLLSIRNIVLDGDNLRTIFGNRWGYEKEERKDLGFVYSRLCQFLSDEGNTVICATVAMFEDVRRWNRENNADYLEVYLQVPLSVLQKRDQKGLYTSYKEKQNADSSVYMQDYELPQNPDLVINNHGDTTPLAAATLILEKVFSTSIDDKGIVNSNMWEGKLKEDVTAYWNKYYKNSRRNKSPSPFAVWCNEHYLKKEDHIIDVGCGDGRDTFYINAKNKIVGIDLSLEAVTNNNNFAIQLTQNETPQIEFINGDFSDFSLDLPMGINVVYSRFVLHAMSEDAQEKFIRRAYSMLPSGGRIMIEFRTINDPLAKSGFVFGKNERITDHYRRFIDFQLLRKRIKAIGFMEIFSVEEKGLAVYKDDNPVVGRIIAEKT